MVRLLKQAQAWMGDIARAWCDHRRAAKKRWQAIEFTRGRPKQWLFMESSGSKANAATSC